jgi:DNA-binding GntR family transcriptional regulator
VTHDAGDIRELLQAKDGFYEVLLEGSGNRCIHTILAGLQARVRVLRATSLSQPGRSEVAVDEIRALVEAIEARDADAAARAAAYHVNKAAHAGLDGLPATDLIAPVAASAQPASAAGTPRP